MKSRVLLILSILFIIFATLQFESIDDIGLIDRTTIHSNNQETDDRSISLLKSLALKLTKNIKGLEREGEQAPTSNAPLTTLLIVGLFGLAFWDRFSLQKQTSKSMRQ